MASWQAWREMSGESLRVAQIAEAADGRRSGVSRYYYAAYQSVTAVLLYLNVTPPANEEAWSHAATPTLLVDHFGPLLPLTTQRRNLAYRLGELYKLRIVADYRGERTVTMLQLDAARKDAGYIVKILEAKLPKGED